MDKRTFLIQGIETQKPEIKKNCKIAFNKSLRTLLSNMRMVFPNDTALLTLEQTTLSKLKKSKCNHIPLILFVEKICLKDDNNEDLGSKILRKDVSIMTNPALSVPMLKAINIVDKWPKLSADNQEIVWKLLCSMVMNSMQYMLLETTSAEQMIDMAMNVLEKKEVPEKLISIKSQISSGAATSTAALFEKSEKEDKKVLEDKKEDKKVVADKKEDKKRVKR